MQRNVEAHGPRRGTAARLNSGYGSLGFGKFAEWPVSAVPVGYLLWAVAQGWVRERHPHVYWAAADVVIEYLSSARRKSPGVEA